MTDPTRRIRGKALRLTLDSTDYYAAFTRCELDNEESRSEITTFYDAAQEGGASQAFLSIEAVQDTSEDSLWSFLWEHTGEEVAFAYAPHGNETPTAAHPHVIGIARIGRRPKLGGQAGATNTYTFETRWDVVSHTLDRGN